MNQQDLLIYGVAGLVFLAIGCVGILLTTEDKTHSARKRAKAVGAGETGKSRTSKIDEETNARRRETQRMLAKLRQQDQARKKSLMPQDM
ncbi:MAG: pilus assembly protein, partial [Pseudomonadota bacterium]